MTAVATSASEDEKERQTIAERCFLAMGTYVTVKVAVPETAQAAAAAAITRIQRRITEFGRDGWAWGDGALARMNLSLARGEIATVPRSLRELFTRAWAFRNETATLFNPLVGRMVRAWGFDDPARIRAEPPDPAELVECLRAVRAAPPYDGSDTYGPAPGVAWDFGGIGKGYIIDVALAELAEAGFTNAMIDAGGNLAVRGSCRDRPWHVGIRDPRPGATDANLLASLDVSGEAVITHGIDQRSFEHEGRTFSHILHGQSGQPVEGLRSLTVVDTDAVLAEAGGLALFAAAAEERATLAARLGIEHLLMVLEDGSIHATRTLAARLRPIAGFKLEVVADEG